MTANGPFEGINVGLTSNGAGDTDRFRTSSGALGDFDNDGTLRPRPSIDMLRLHVFVSRAGDLDLVVGENEGTLKYMENIGTSTAPVFVARTGSANPFDGIEVPHRSAPALGDFDNDGTLGPRPSIDKLRYRMFCVSRRRS